MKTLDAIVTDLENVASGALLVEDWEVDPDDAATLLGALDPGAAAFEGWADLELMGHRTRVAYVKPVELAHRGFLELTWKVGERGFREIYSPSAVFCLTPLESEEQATQLLEARNSELRF